MIKRGRMPAGHRRFMFVVSGNFAELEEVLQKWFKQVRTSNVPVDGTVVRSKAAELAHIMGINDFKASNGWINRFRQRHGLVYRSIRGEAAGVNRYTVDTWKDRLQVLLNDYRPDDVFNADEMGLFYRILPDKTLTFKGENCSGDKLSKERLTVLLCCNESGTEMVKPLVIVLGAMNFLNSAWNSIDANAVINCFNKSGFCRKLFNSAVVEDTDESVTISKEWQQIAGTNATFSDYVDCDSSLFAFQQSSLKEILGQHQADANQEDNDDDGDKEQEALPIPTLTAAFEAMDTVRHYVCSFNVDEKVINQLSKIVTVICELGKKHETNYY
ncbi:tigger transposable element-derived protein 6 [Trichinella spiralis]|uniref:tigger transposable element-derived protein 6 n=1 Tax=Trichinella spiralis TaxID=6334 RepID=UPI0001EFE58C|nr:tigger transposable element-derived protein 6 [Trichinella spiralis]